MKYIYVLKFTIDILSFNVHVFVYNVFANI